MRETLPESTIKAEPSRGVRLNGIKQLCSFSLII